MFCAKNTAATRFAHRVVAGDRARLPEEPLHRHQVEQLVTVVQAPAGIHQLQPVCVAVQRDAVVGLVLANGIDQRLRRGGTEAGVDVLCPAAPAVVTDDDVQLAVGPEADDAAVVVAALLLVGISLAAAKLDDVAVERQGGGTTCLGAERRDQRIGELAAPIQ